MVTLRPTKLRFIKKEVPFLNRKVDHLINYVDGVLIAELVVT